MPFKELFKIVDPKTSKIHYSTPIRCIQDRKSKVEFIGCGSSVRLHKYEGTKYWICPVCGTVHRQKTLEPDSTYQPTIEEEEDIRKLWIDLQRLSDTGKFMPHYRVTYGKLINIHDIGVRKRILN